MSQQGAPYAHVNFHFGLSFNQLTSKHFYNGKIGIVSLLNSFLNIPHPILIVQGVSKIFKLHLYVVMKKTHRCTVILNLPKSSVCIMTACDGSGILLPPFVFTYIFRIYGPLVVPKEHVKGIQNHSGLNRNLFLTIALPHLKKQVPAHVLIR